MKDLTKIINQIKRQRRELKYKLWADDFRKKTSWQICDLDGKNIYYSDPDMYDGVELPYRTYVMDLYVNDLKKQINYSKWKI